MILVIPETLQIPAGDYFTNDAEQNIYELADFRISKNLTTNSDFYQFIDDTTSHKEFSYHEKIREISHFDDFPVINITWYQALDFCQWLSDKSDLNIDLPTERQWERAARGFDGLLYPWGEFYEPNRSPSLDAQSMSASPIAAYPEGASPFGVLDMCGNVWQWTNTKTDSEEIKLKGGCWMDSGWGVRANRYLLADPKLATNNTGFRFVINERR
jgi:formylglycine-generating enzyme required for sulfatase activity